MTVTRVNCIVRNHKWQGGFSVQVVPLQGRWINRLNWPAVTDWTCYLAACLLASFEQYNNGRHIMYTRRHCHDPYVSRSNKTYKYSSERLLLGVSSTSPPAKSTIAYGHTGTLASHKF